MVKKLIRKLFKYETMDGGGACPIYLERWELFNILGYEMYLHHFLADDWALDPHDHPRRFISIGLKGQYTETVYKQYKDGTATQVQQKIYKAPWLRSFPAEHIHRIELPKGKTAWTLVIVLHKTRTWGFYPKGKWIEWRKYVHGGNARKSC